MYSIQYMYILLSCISAEVDEMMVIFSCHRTGMGRRFRFFFCCCLLFFCLLFFPHCGQYGYTVYVQQFLSFCLCLRHLVSVCLSPHLSLCTDFLCVSVCSRQDLRLICKLSAIAAHYVNVCIYRKNCNGKY